MVEKDYIKQLMDKVGEDIEDSPLVITPAQVRYIADYLAEEFLRCKSFSETSLDCLENDLDLEQLISTAILSINGGAMDGYAD